MRISELLEGLDAEWEKGPLNGDIKGIAYDSRLAGKDHMFVAVKGHSVDGHNYIKDAVSRGATVVVAEHPVEITDSERPGVYDNITFVRVHDSRKALALASSAFYGHPSQRLSLIGITGTNGKTTTSFITKNIIEAGGWKAGLLGTIRYITGDGSANAVHTTPESLDLQRYLREMVDNNMQYGVLEVSSHALALKRVEGCSFEVAAFTNFTQDHLDFHHSMDEYFDAKRRLFDYLDSGGTAVLNVDDERIKSLSDTFTGKAVTCGIERKAMIMAENIRDCGTADAEGGGLSFDVRTPEGTYGINSKLLGRFNAYNILLSIGIAYASGINEDAIREGVRQAEPVEGRFQQISAGQKFLCIIDYAHTEDALRKLIHEARRLTRGRVVTVFGCGGDRDRTKRPLMGAAASELSDLVIITSDNPRTEEPSAIIKDIVKGIRKNNFTLQPDRGEAIREAVSLVSEADTLIIAGKGHENYQEVHGVRRHFSDKEAAVKEIKRLLSDSAS